MICIASSDSDEVIEIEPSLREDRELIIEESAESRSVCEAFISFTYQESM